MIRLLKRLQKRDILFILIVVTFVVISVWLTLTIPDYMNRITSLVNSQGETSEVIKAGLIMLLCAIGEACCTVIVGYSTSQISANFSRNLRASVYNAVVDFSMEEIGDFSTASLVTRTGNDVTQITFMIAMGLQAILRAPIIAIWAVFKILDKDTSFLVVTGVAIVIVIALIVSNIAIVIPKFKILQKLTDNINRLMGENITGVRVVRAYNAEGYQKDKFEKANSHITGIHLFTGRAIAYLMPGMQFVMSTTALAIYLVGAFLIQNSPVPERLGIYSDLVVFMAYAIQILMAFMMLVMIFILLPRAQVSAGRINQVLDRKPRIKDGPLADDVPDKGCIEVRNVSFKYPDAEEKVLDGISFKAEKGDTVAFIGSTGCGKSTLINLIPRFYDVTEGSVLVDGVDVREYSLRNLRKKIGYVSQKAILFKGTLRSNIDYGENKGKGDDNDIIHALEVAQGMDILNKNADGLDTAVAQAGSNFSGGQKQRISIARAIYKHPEIFIFDDSFSALDYKTDKNLRAALREETADATVLIVAQRIGTVKDADTIVVLDEGKVAGIGRHEDLLASCSVYQQIAYSQLSEEELKNAR
ncbi:MAG: ABC transporter ATP-binding protein [Lachnospiraceae bacterium]|nr:ABC transporter ATP-binding protein [Lachnospiraceae bacterium]